MVFARRAVFGSVGRKHYDLYQRRPSGENIHP